MNQDTLNRIIREAQRGNFSFSDATFAETLTEVVDRFVFDQDKYDHVDKTFDRFGDKFNLSSDEKEALVNLQKVSPFIDDEDTAETFLPIALYNLRNRKVDHRALAKGGKGKLGSSVKFLFQTSRASQQINRASIESAADLFYSMVIGEELEVFNAADMLLSKHLSSRRYAIRLSSRETIDAIRLYDRAGRFEDIETGALYDRSQEPDRMQDYKMLFNYGQVMGIDEADVNTGFQPLWDTLMIEVAKYIEKVESSTTFENVSKNNIFQAIEDLQVNLSDWSSSSIEASAGLYYKELEFISARFFNDKDILQQVGRREPTDVGVLKQLLADLNEMRSMPSQHVDGLLKKAMLGYQIIMEIAQYSPARMDDHFGEFISMVQAYFVAQDLLERQHNEAMPTYPEPGRMSSPYAPQQAPMQDDFNF
ncbi:hypothetical protein ACAW74_13905 [Fibrella sp. WM1]|uniref:hypothetical protein n=1 Tax=Fibrella musci TaxID=3242485 RepID=UPI00351FDE5E